MRAIADRLRSGLRPTDVVSRVGGDEFVVMRTGARALDDAEQLGNDVMALLREPFVLDEGELRRRGAADLSNVLRFDSLEIGLNAGRAWIAGRDVELTAKEFELLAFLAAHAGEIFSREILLHEVWRSSSDWQNPTTVTEHIHRLRCRVELDPSRPRLIRTVRGVGYCFGPPRPALAAG